MQKKSERIEWLPLLAILSASLYIRISFFTGFIGEDSYYYSLFAYYRSQNISLQIIKFTSYFSRTMLSYPIAFIYKYFGVSETTTYFYPIFISLLTIIFVYLIGHYYFHPKVGLLSASLWGIFPLSVNYSSQLTPDILVAGVSTGGIFFYLLGELNTGKKRWGAFIISGFFFGIAFFTKKSVFVLFLVVILLIFHHRRTALLVAWIRFNNASKSLKAGVFTLFVLAVGILFLIQPNKILFSNNLTLTSLDSSQFLILGLDTPIHFSDLGRGYWVWQINGDLVSPYNYPFTFSVFNNPSNFRQLDLFNGLSLLMILSIIFAIKKNDHKVNTILIWFGFSFFYMEWGSFPRGLSLPASLYYTPVTYWIDTRNFLFILIPAFLLMGLFIAEELNLHQARKAVTFSSLMILATTWLLTHLENPDMLIERLSWTYGILIIGVFLYPLISTRNDRKYKQLIYFTLIGFMLIPSMPFHSWDYYKEHTFKENVKSAIPYLDSFPEIPILAEEGVGTWVNYYSGFEYGLDNQFSIVDTSFRIHDTSLEMDSTISEFFFISEGELTSPVFHFSEEDPRILWPVVTYGQGPHALAIYYSTSGNIDQEKFLSEFSQYNKFNNSNNDIGKFVYGVFTEDIEQMINTWGSINSQPYANNLLSEVISHMDSISFVPVSSWSTGAEILENIEIDEAFDSLIDSKGNLVVLSKDKTKLSVSTITLLKPNTLYRLTVKIKSSSKINIVSFNNKNVVFDSWISTNRVTDWAELEVFFITSDEFNETSPTLLNLFTIVSKGELLINEITLDAAGVINE